MVENIKEKIAQVSRELFNTHGYQAVTMRQIADGCGISVGNLTYHYPHKEDLLMLEHDWILSAFLDEALSGENELSGLRGYFTVECAFLHRILSDPPVARLYDEVINVPSLRERYCRAHHELYRYFLPETADDGPAWVSTVAMSSLEFGLPDVDALTDFARGMENIFRAKLIFENRDPADYEDTIKTAVKSGIALSKRLAAKA